MDSNTAARQHANPAHQRPAWLRVLLWVGVAFILFNTLGAALFFVSRPSINIGTLVRLALVGAVVALPLWKWHGMQVLRTWNNPKVASFTRRDDPATGGILFDVEPARAARVPALPLFAFAVFLLLNALLVGTRSTGAFVGLYVVALVCIGVGCTFVLPGARDRKPVKVSVARHGLQSGDIGMPLNVVTDLRVTLGGLVVDRDSLMPGRNGVSTAAMAGRHMGRRQAARGYAVTIRADGESQSILLSGGLTEDCAHALTADLGKAIEIERGKLAAVPAAASVAR
ncbi:hypothetical protein [Roseovarius sp. 217]|uniref:hypothetical protein n=1 Tax=Roseovarius sp. (strain 217) TaxID=314264 RepID=UPI0003215009|nr:hypothetical protein [Roseovarius sp. 217]